MKKRKSYSKELKARVALDTIKGQKTVGEPATEYAIHTNQISQWKRNQLDGASELFARVGWNLKFGKPHGVAS